MSRKNNSQLIKEIYEKNFKLYGSKKNVKLLEKKTKKQLLDILEDLNKEINRKREEFLKQEKIKLFIAEELRKKKEKKEQEKKKLIISVIKEKKPIEKIKHEKNYLKEKDEFKNKEFNFYIDDLGDNREQFTFKRNLKVGVPLNEIFFKIFEQLTDDTVEKFKEFYEQTFDKENLSDGNIKFQIVLEDKKGNIVSATPFTGIIEASKEIIKNRILKNLAKYEGAEELKIHNIKVRGFFMPKLVGGHIHRKFNSANDKWLIINPRTEINCLFVSIAVNRFFVKNPKILYDFKIMNKKGADLKNAMKKKLKIKFKGLSSFKEAKLIADYYGFPIEIYDNTFKLIKKIEPVQLSKNYKKYNYNVQIDGPHMLALIDRNLLELHKIDFSKCSLLEIYRTDLAKSLLGYNKVPLKEIKNDDFYEVFDNREKDFISNKYDHLKTAEIYTGGSLLSMLEFYERENNKKKFKVVNIINPYLKIKKEFKKSIEKKELSLKREYCEFIKEEYPYEIATWDIEAYRKDNGDFVPYAVGLSYFLYDYDEIKKELKNKQGKKVIKIYRKIKPETKRIVNKQFWSKTDCLLKFLNYIAENAKIFDKYTFYAHNGGKFDIPLLIKYGLLNKCYNCHIDIKSCIELNNSWISFGIKITDGEYKGKIKFLDSYRLLPFPLKKLLQDLNTEHQKLDETINHDDINEFNYYKIKELRIYLNNDTLGLLEALEIYSKEIFDDSGIPITNCLTSASLSKKIFFKHFYFNGLQTLSDDDDSFIRKSYFGGRVECFNIGEVVGKIYYYDFTSLYPDVGRLDLPFGEPKRKIFEKPIKVMYSEFFGFIRCRVKTINKNILPLHGIIHNSRLVFPYFEDFTELYIFSEEIRYDIYEYEFLEAIAYERKPFMKEFFETGFKKKAEAKKQGKPALAQVNKIVINSGYGFWGIRTKDRDGIIITHKTDPDFITYFLNEKLINANTANYMIFARVLKDLNISNHNVGISAAISSYARIKTHRLLVELKKVGEIYYCDTDSVICNTNLNDFPELKKKFQWDGNGDDLGSLKNEAHEFKDLKKNIENENGNVYFDRCIINGCKMYGLKRDNIEIVKCKGYSQKEKKLKYEEMKILGESEIKQLQNQFRCPKNNYVSQTNSFVINLKSVEKKFKRLYTKGVVNGSKVSPLSLKQSDFK